MRRSGWLKGAALGLCGLTLAVSACSGKDPAGSESDSMAGTTVDSTTGTSSSTSGSSSDGTTMGTGTATGTTTSTSSSSSTSETSVGFLVPMDIPGASQCDPTLQDCPDGEKCTAVSMVEGEPWGTNVCISVTGDGALGDPCNVEGGKYTGVDNCAEGFICLLTDADGKGGTCIEFCDGNMLCPQSGAECAVYNGGSLPICLANCDPLVQDCDPGQGCYPSAGGNSFICFKTSVDVGEGGQGDGCTYVNQCQPGLMCVAVDSLMGCQDPSGCCSPFCSVMEGSGPCNPGEECVPYFADGEAPPQYADVGVCVIPA